VELFYPEAGVLYATIRTLNSSPPSKTMTCIGQLVSSVNGKNAIKSVTAGGSEEGPQSGGSGWAD